VVTNWQPPADLARLLEALAEEIIASTDGELLSACIASSRSANTTTIETYALLARIRDFVDVAMDDETAESERQLLVAEGEGACELRQRPH
jgi:hypothetical protein